MFTTVAPASITSLNHLKEIKPGPRGRASSTVVKLHVGDKVRASFTASTAISSIFRRFSARVRP